MLAALADGPSPMFEHIPGFPDPRRVDVTRAATIRRQLEALAAFQARVRETAVTTDREKRTGLARALRDEYDIQADVSTGSRSRCSRLSAIAWGGPRWWTTSTAFPPRSAISTSCGSSAAWRNRSPATTSLRLEGSRRSFSCAAIAPSDRGYSAGVTRSSRTRHTRPVTSPAYEDHLDRAIGHYERGMKLDLNDFFPSSNLPFLYRQRGGPGDEDRARITAQLARLACERDVQSSWAKPTLLTLAFFDEDVDWARGYAREVRRQGPAVWQLGSTIDTLEKSVEHVRDERTKEDLGKVLSELRSLL